MPYEGTEEATPERVRRYLRDNYTDTDGSALSDARLTELLTDHANYIDDGEKFGSYAHHVGDQIAEDAELTATDGE